jgi:hypothetical protein
MTEEFSDYWYEYDKLIPFPATPGNERRIGNFVFATTHSKTGYLHFWITYVGTEPEMVAALNRVIANKHYRYHCEKLTIDNRVFWSFKGIYSQEYKLRYCYQLDVISNIKTMLSDYDGYSAKPIQSQDYKEIIELLQAESKLYRKIRKQKFQEKFGKTLEEHFLDKQKEKEQYKDIGYTIMVGEVYATLRDLKNACEEIMNLKNLRNNLIIGLGKIIV